MSKKNILTIAGSGYERADFLAKYVPPPLPTGNVYFVQSTATAKGDTTGKGQSPDAPFATIAYAATQVTADNDDLIVVLPGHVETLTAAAGVALATAGTNILGVGKGRQRPTVNYTTAAAASFDVTAARCRVENITFTPIGVASVTAAINVSAADFSLVNCEMELANGTNQAVLGVLTTAAANRLRIEGCHIHGTTNAGTAAAIRIVGGTDIQVVNNVIVGAYTTSKGGIDNITTAITNLIVSGNVIANQTASSTVAINLNSSTTGMVVNNRLSILSGTAPIVGAALNGVGGNYYAAAAGVTAGTLV